MGKGLSNEPKVMLFFISKQHITWAQGPTDHEGSLSPSKSIAGSNCHSIRGVHLELSKDYTEIVNEKFKFSQDALKIEKNSLDLFFDPTEIGRVVPWSSSSYSHLYVSGS